MNDKNEFLLIREWKYSDKNSSVYREDVAAWDMVGGGMNWGEGFREWLMREIEEELGAKEISDYIISPDPLIIQVSELDDRYHDDKEKDDFYPVCMFYYAVKFYHFDFSFAPANLEMQWLPLEKFSETFIWSHVQSFQKVFNPSDFPDSFISNI